MAIIKKETLGMLLIVIFVGTGITYISLRDDLRLRMDDDKAVFYVKDSRWLISGLQEDRLFNGSRIVDRIKSTIIRGNYTENGSRIEYRYTKYDTGGTILHKWVFEPNPDRIEDFPIDESICINNSKDRFYRYSLKKLVDVGPKRKLSGTTSKFGRNMEVEFESGYSWAWIGWPYGKDSFAVQYKIKSDYECFNIRLFDPLILSLTLNDIEGNATYEYGTTAEIITNFTCIDILDDTGRVIDVCDKTFGSPELYYKLEDNLSTIGPNMTEVIAPLTYQSGILNDGFYSNALTHLLANPSTLTHTTKLTINAWIKSDDSPGGEEDFVLICRATGGTCGNNIIQLRKNANDTIQVRIVISGTPILDIGGIVATGSDVWIMTTFTLDGTNARIYINGTLTDTKPFTADVSITQTEIRISGNREGLLEFDGMIDDVSVFPFAQPQPWIDARWNDSDGSETPLNSSLDLADRNYTIDLLRINNFNDSNLNKTLLKNGTLFINTSSKKELYNFSINLTGYPKNATNVSIDINLDGIKDFEVIGWIIDQNYFVNWFTYSGTEYLRTNLTFLEAGEQIVHFNLSTSTPDAKGNISFTLTGFDIDSGNDLDFSFSFNDTAKENTSINITINISSPVGIYDNFEVNTTISEWEFTQFDQSNSNPSTSGITAGNFDDSVFVVASPGSWSAFEGHSLGSYLHNTVIDLKTNSLIIFDWQGSVNAGLEGSRTAQARIEFFDGINSVIILGLEDTSNQPQSVRQNITLRKTTNPNIWDRFINGVSSGTISTSSLDSSQKLGIRLFQSQSYSGAFDSSLTSSSRLFNLELGGIYLNKTFNDNQYAPNGTWESDIILTSEKSISAAWLFVNDTEPSGTEIIYFLSGDNGTSYTTATPNFRTPLPNTGPDNALKLIVNLTTNNVAVTPKVYSINVRVIPVSLANISVSLGGFKLFDINGTFNNTFTFNSSAEIISRYINETNCGTKILCSIPLVIESEKAGEIQLSDINITKGFNPINFNVSSIQDFNRIPINITMRHGNLTVNDIRYDYRGDKNITVLAHSEDYSSNISRIIFVKYSKFNVTIIPPNIDEWNLGTNLYSYNQLNVEPFGNEDGQGNPFFNASQTVWFHPINIYIKYNESINTCQNTTFSGLNRTINETFNVVLNTTSKLLVTNLTTGVTGINQINISTLTNVSSCSNENSTLLFPFFCFHSLCMDCVKTFDWEDNCELIR